VKKGGGERRVVFRRFRGHYQRKIVHDTRWIFIGGQKRRVLQKREETDSWPGVVVVRREGTETPQGEKRHICIAVPTVPEFTK